MQSNRTNKWLGRLAILGMGLGLTGCGVDAVNSGGSVGGENPTDGTSSSIFDNGVDDGDGDDSVRTFAAFSASGVNGLGTAVDGRGPGLDVMDQKLGDAIAALSDPAAQEQVQLAAVDQVMEALFISNLVLLPTAGVIEADPTIFDHQQAMQQAIAALSAHIDPILGPGTENTKAAAWDARNFLQLFQEAAAVIGQTTAVCDPGNLRDPACELLLADDEGGTDVDSIFPGFSRQVRSPFFIGASGDIIQEQVILPGVIGLDECVVVLKEIQGVKAVVRKVLIPIWVEPWNARAAIVGFTTVWVWEFVPAEFLKTISYCNVGGSVVQDIDIVVVLERELLHFWSFLFKDVQLSP